MSTIPPAPNAAPPQAPVEKKKPHVLGIIAFIAALVGFVFACVPGALIIGWILLPIAFVLSIVALFLKGSKWPAITGLILAIVGTIVGFIVFFALVVNAADKAFGDDKPASSQQQASEESSEKAAGDDAADADYVVTIDGASQTKDYDGKSVLVVDFTFTNNSADEANFMFAASAQAFQDGVELEDAIFVDDKYDTQNAMKDIKPGKSIPVQWGYVLDGKTDVTVEVSELLSFDDAKLATKTFAVK